jgi:hypothetical protein
MDDRLVPMVTNGGLLFQMLKMLVMSIEDVL